MTPIRPTLCGIFRMPTRSPVAPPSPLMVTSCLLSVRNGMVWLNSSRIFHRGHGFQAGVDCTQHEDCRSLIHAPPGATMMVASRSVWMLNPEWYVLRIPAASLRCCSPSAIPAAVGVTVGTCAVGRGGGDGCFAACSEQDREDQCQVEDELSAFHLQIPFHTNDFMPGDCPGGGGQIQDTWCAPKLSKSGL